MSNFDKVVYWQRRKEGKRGQDELPAPKLFKTSNVMLGFERGGKPVPKNRKQRRQRAIDRTFTKKGYKAVYSKVEGWITNKIAGTRQQWL